MEDGSAVDLASLISDVGGAEGAGVFAFDAGIDGFW